MFIQLLELAWKFAWLILLVTFFHATWPVWETLLGLVAKLLS